MREILFKAKSTDNGEWIEGSFLQFDDDCAYIIPRYKYASTLNKIELALATMKSVDPSTLCQYTGLTDRNGERIWENDIVANKWCFICGNSVVKFGEYKNFHMPEDYQYGNLGFYLEHTYNFDKNYRKDMMYFAGRCEILGNIFDNPELLD